MKWALSILENFPPELREFFAAQQAELSAKDALIEKLGGQLTQLQERFELMVKRLYGRKSEKLDPNQILLEAG